MRKYWYDLVGKDQIQLKDRDGGYYRHLRELIGKDILVPLLPYLEGKYVRDLIAYDIIDVACDIDFTNGIFTAITWPMTSDLSTFDSHAANTKLSKLTNKDRQKFLDGAAWEITFNFLYLEEDLYKQYQMELVWL